MVPQRLTMKILRLLHMIYPKHHYKMVGELVAVELVVQAAEVIMTFLMSLKWPKLTVVHRLMMETSMTYKSTLALLAERAPVARGREQQDKVLEAVMRMD